VTASSTVLDLGVYIDADLSMQIVSEMTYTVSSGTLNSSIPYHTIPQCRSMSGGLSRDVSPYYVSCVPSGGRYHLRCYSRWWGRPVRTKSHQNESIFRCNRTKNFVLMGVRSDGIFVLTGIRSIGISFTWAFVLTVFRSAGP